VNERCEYCGCDKIYSGPPDCPRCGAPVCCEVCCREETIKQCIKELKARQTYLPKITDEIRAEFEDTCLMENDGTKGWSQEAVDFACLLNSTLAEQEAGK
jgi:hypothetical protein